MNYQTIVVSRLFQLKTVVSEHIHTKCLTRYKCIKGIHSLTVIDDDDSIGLEGIPNLIDIRYSLDENLMIHNSLHGLFQPFFGNRNMKVLTHHYIVIYHIVLLVFLKQKIISDPQSPSKGLIKRHGTKSLR